ncbi:MAG: hypothetical protein ACTSPQ_22595 [Candidatus Helarchaeota archaeon]
MNGNEAVNEVIKYTSKINDISKMSDVEAEMYLKYLMDNQGLRLIQGTGCFLHLEDKITKEVIDEEKREYENDENFYYWTSYKSYNNAMEYYQFCRKFAKENIKDSELLGEFLEIVDNEELKITGIFTHRQATGSKKNIYQVVNFIVNNKRTNELEFILSVRKLIDVYREEEKMHNVFKEREMKIINYGMFDYH